MPEICKGQFIILPFSARLWQQAKQTFISGTLSSSSLGQFQGISGPEGIYIVSQSSSRFTMKSFPSWLYLEELQRGMSFITMPKLPQLPLFDTKGQLLYSKFLMFKLFTLSLMLCPATLLNGNSLYPQFYSLKAFRSLWP